MSQKLWVPPAVLPLTRSEVKEHLRIENDADDAYLDGLVAAATDYVQSATGLSLIDCRWRLYYDNWPDKGVIEFPVAPVQFVSRVFVNEAAGTVLTLGAEDYAYENVSRPARMQLRASPPPMRELNGLEIEVQCGFGSTGVSVPGQLRRALLLLCAHWYEHRSAGSHGQAGPNGIARLIAPFRRACL